MPNKNIKKAPAGVPHGMVTRANLLAKPNTYREADNSVEFILATEEPARVWDWERFDVIREVIAADGVIVPKNGQIPLVDSHDRSTIDNILGSVREIRREGAEVIGRLYFANTDAAKRAAEMIREGHLDSGSVGYEQNETQWINDGESVVYNGRSFSGPMLLTRKWSPKEFSLVAIGADPNAKARAKAESVAEQIEGNTSREAVEQIDKEIVTMENLNKPVEQPQTVDVEAIKREALQAEQLRAAKIAELCDKRGCADMAAEFIRSAANVESVQEKILDTIASRTVALSTAKVEVGKEAGEKLREAATDGILMRSGMRVKNAAAGAEQMRGMGFADIARTCLEEKGISTRLMGKQEILTRAMSTSDFPNILANVANKAVMMGYQMGQNTWRAWAKPGMLPDFKASKRVRLSDAPEMVLNRAGEEVQHGIISDVGEEMTLKTYARKLIITREALINDDAGLFNRVFSMFGQRAANDIEAAVYAVLTGNPTMSDSGTLFNTTAVTTAGGHANQASSGAVVSSTTVAAALVAMGKQVGEQGSALSLMGKYIIGGFENKVQTDLLVNSTTDTTANGNADFNPFRNFIGITTGHISTKKWFLVSDMLDSVEVAFLDGKETPTLYAVENSGDILGRTFVGYIDYVAKALEWRSMFYNPGQ
ncbi:MAG TPA: hypothetical protein PLM07_20630 [Candidatus Rifleibacterium sp.]|nr:hypothetical protein [Candidatus Rifleibacterium sp.]